MSLLGALRERRRLLAGPAALFILALGAGGVFLVTGGTASGQQTPVSTSKDDILSGELLYQAHCQSCHGYEGEGGATSAPALYNVGAAAADFYLTTGRMPLNNPANEPLRHRPYFNPTQIGQLVAYINALPVITGTFQFGPTIPTVEPLCASTPPTTATTSTTTPSGCVNLSDGQAAFAINCASCHQAAGSGGMLSKGIVVPSLHNSNPTQVAEAIRVGPKPMPVFGPAELTDAQLSAIVHYVQYLHHPSNPGGLPITHFGPVAEGFVGVIIGFGLLWFATRMIGNRG